MGESADAKQMFDLQQKNKQLSEPLRRAHQDVDRLQDELRMYEMDKKKLNEVKEKLYNQFLQEREKINYFWIVEKKTLSERQAELRNKERELQDLEERQQIELKMFH